VATSYIQAVINKFRDSLSQGANYDEVDGVDQLDKWYDDTYEDFLESTIKEIGTGAAQRDLYKGVKFNVGGGRGRDGRFEARTSAENYIQSSDAPEYLLDIFGSDEEGKPRVEEEAQSAYAVLAITDSPEQVATVLGGYYGIDFSPIAQNIKEQSFGGFNLSRKGREKDLRGHTDSSIAQINEFHSFIEPILQDQIPFLMMTRGMSYQNALQATFEEDPMIQALYGKYGVLPIRQSDIQRDEGRSTYLYDPFSFGEIRTFRARDDNLKYVKIAAAIATAYFAPQLLLKTGAFGTPAAAAGAGTAAGAAGAAGYSAAQLAAATAAVSAATTAVSGGDFKDILKSAGLSFAGSTVAQQLGNAQAAATPGTTEYQAAINAGSTAAQLADNYTKAKVIYAATQIASGAATGNVGAGFLAAFGPDLTTVALDKVGLTSEVLDRAGVNQNLLVSGLVKTQTALARGMNLDTALAAGLGQYILSGGGIAGVNKDTFFKKMGEVLRDTGEALGGLFSPSQTDISSAAKGINYESEGSGGVAGLTEAQQDLEREEFSDLLTDDEYIRKYGIAAFDMKAAEAAEMSEVLGGYKPSAGLVDENGVPIFEDVNGLQIRFKEKPSLWANIFRNTKDIPLEQKLELADQIIDAPQFQAYLDAAGISLGDRLNPQEALNKLFEQSFGAEAPATTLNFEEDSGIADSNTSVANTFIANGVTELNIEGTKYTTEQLLPGMSPEARAASIGLAIDQIANAMYEEDRANGGNSDLADFRLDAMNAYVELRGEGYSHLRLLEESGVKLTGRLVNAVSALDLSELAQLRNSDPEAYTDKLGRTDSVTGNKESVEYVKENGAESATNGISVYEMAQDAVEAANNVSENILPAMLASGMNKAKARKLAADLEAGVVNTTANMIRAGAGFTKAMLGLTYLFGTRPDDLKFGQEVNKLLELGDSANTEGYQDRVKEMWSTIQEAEGFWNTTQAWADAFVDDPTIMLAEIAGVEFFQEVGPLLVGGGVGAIAKGATLAAAKVAGKGAVSTSAKVAANQIGIRSGMSAAAATDASEAFGGSADGAYDEAFDAKLKQLQENNQATIALMQAAGIPVGNLLNANGLFAGQMDEIHEFAHNAAMLNGSTAAVLSLISYGMGGEALDKFLLGGKKGTLDPKVAEAVKELGDRIDAGDSLVAGLQAAKTIGTEGLFEYVEEALTATQLEAFLKSVDPNRDWGAAIASAGMGGLVGGSGVTAAVLGIDSAQDALAGAIRSTHAGINATIEGAKNGLINDAEARAALAEFGITSDEYGGLQTSLLNDAFDADYTTYTESRDAFQAENPDYEPTEADILQFTGARAEDRLKASVADLVDRSYIDAQEVINTAAREGLTLTEEQAARYVQQTESGQANTVLGQLRSNVFDPLYTTKTEARQYFRDLEYRPTGEDLAAFIGKSEKYTSDNVADYSENMLLLQLDGLLSDPDATSTQIDRVLDLIESINPESTAREDFGVDEDGTPPDDDTGYEPPEYELPPDDPVDDDPVDDDPVDDDPVDDDPVDDDPVDDDPVDDPVDDDPVDDDPVDDDPDDPEEGDPEEDDPDDPDAVTKEDLEDLEEGLLERIEELAAEGKTRDEALEQAIEELAGDLGTTKKDLLDAIAASELSIREDFKDELADLETKLSKDIEGISEDVDTAKRDLLEKIDEAEQAGKDRDTALGDAISDLAEELGITEKALLESIGESEESLRTLIGDTEADLLRAIRDTEATLTAELEDVAELVGKPASEVTDADIEFVADLIAQQEAINDPETYKFTQEQLAYDVTGDGVIDQADLDLLQQAATGQDVLFDLESKFAPTGIYATQQELAQQQQQTQTQIAQEAQQAKRRDLFDQLMGAADLTGQQVTVQQSPLTQIDYLYDFGSILGPQQRAGMFPTPYGTIDRPQPRNTPSLPALPPIPRKRGGVIDTNEELLRIIGEK